MCFSLPATAFPPKIIHLTNEKSPHPKGREPCTRGTTNLLPLPPGKLCCISHSKRTPALTPPTSQPLPRADRAAPKRPSASPQRTLHRPAPLCITEKAYSSSSSPLSTKGYHKNGFLARCGSAPLPFTPSPPAPSPRAEPPSPRA